MTSSDHPSELIGDLGALFREAVGALQEMLVSGRADDDLPTVADIDAQLLRWAAWLCGRAAAVGATRLGN